MTQRNSQLRVGPALAASLAITACASLQPPPPAEARLRESAPLTAATTGTGNWPVAQWWHDYHDSTLDTLIESAISQAPGIATADARIHAAEQEVRIASSALGLKIDAHGQFQRQRLSDNGLLPTTFLGFNWYNQSDLGVTVRYQFDWWGKQHAVMEAALARTQALGAERQAAELALTVAVSESYFGWQADAARSALEQESVGLLEQALVLAERRAAADLDRADTAISVRQALGMHRENLALLQGQQQLRVITLAALLGISVADLPPLAAKPLPRSAATLPYDVSTNLLAKRPDIAASRLRVQAALHDTDGARASFYPDISLHALAGLSSIDLGRLLQAGSAAPTMGIAIDLPLFDAGMRRARHGAAQASLALAIADYNETIVNAAREAGTAAAAIEQAATQRKAREEQLAAAHSLLEVARARVRAELTHLGPQLDARIKELNEQDALIRVDLAAVLADVQLKQALGGGTAPVPMDETR